VKHASVILYFRAPEKYASEVDAAATKAGMNRSAFIRQAVQEKTDRAQHTEALVASLSSVTKQVRGLRAVCGMLFELQRETLRALLLRTREPQGDALNDALAQLELQQRKVLTSVVASYQRGDVARLVEETE
jgi:metal-responsive CopG/Arc/MetJ family transcriptional regulator